MVPGKTFTLPTSTSENLNLNIPRFNPQDLRRTEDIITSKSISALNITNSPSFPLPDGLIITKCITVRSHRHLHKKVQQARVKNGVFKPILLSTSDHHMYFFLLSQNVPAPLMISTQLSAQFRCHSLHPNSSYCFILPSITSSKKGVNFPSRRIFDKHQLCFSFIGNHHIATFRVCF